MEVDAAIQDERAVNLISTQVQSSQYNTWESAILAVCCFFVAAEEKLPAPLFSELARSS